MQKNASEFQVEYCSISSASVCAIQRSLMELQDQGGNLFFGEPAFDIKDFLKPINRDMVK